MRPRAGYPFAVLHLQLNQMVFHSPPPSRLIQSTLSPRTSRLSANIGSATMPSTWRPMVMLHSFDLGSVMVANYSGSSKTVRHRFCCRGLDVRLCVSNFQFTVGLRSTLACKFVTVTFRWYSEGTVRKDVTLIHATLRLSTKPGFGGGGGSSNPLWAS